MTNAECLKLIICAIDKNYEPIKQLLLSLESKHNSKEFKALLEAVAQKISE